MPFCVLSCHRPRRLIRQVQTHTNSADLDRLTPAKQAGTAQLILNCAVLEVRPSVLGGVDVTYRQLFNAAR